VLSGALVGFGFETKMAVALMVVPGIVAAYLCRSVMAAVKNSCNPVDSVEGLYDCQGAASALAASGH
jgi:hypothetical protein